MKLLPLSVGLALAATAATATETPPSPTIPVEAVQEGMNELNDALSALVKPTKGRIDASRLIMVLSSIFENQSEETQRLTGKVLAMAEEKLEMWNEIEDIKAAIDAGAPPEEDARLRKRMEALVKMYEVSLIQSISAAVAPQGVSGEMRRVLARQNPFTQAMLAFTRTVLFTPLRNKYFPKP